MLEPLLESEKKEKILFFLYSHGEGYPREIARTFRFNLNTVQNQLQKLESHGILCSQLKGKVRIFSFNPRYPLRDELEALLKKAMMYLPENEVRTYYWPQIQPRRAGRPPDENTLQGGISFALSNPWEKSRLDRFRPSQKISKKNSSANFDVSRKK
ncbi:MAG TPA: winged helix-turn-helix domain-containing protein [Candidatus Heimdallarchaeota archaeon]|nr:winged helix-turn-helix domain-containing protein [Candidatus Heimdallarchaeota archaeon]